MYILFQLIMSVVIVLTIIATPFAVVWAVKKRNKQVATYESAIKTIARELNAQYTSLAGNHKEPTICVFQGVPIRYKITIPATNERLELSFFRMSLLGSPKSLSPGPSFTRRVGCIALPIQFDGHLYFSSKKAGDDIKASPKLFYNYTNNFNKVSLIQSDSPLGKDFNIYSDSNNAWINELGNETINFIKQNLTDYDIEIIGNNLYVVQYLDKNESWETARYRQFITLMLQFEPLLRSLKL